MKKSIIWAIIGLLTVAVLGVLWLQMDLIRTSIKVNENKFDKAVYEVLNKVAERLEEEEKRQAAKQYLNGYAARFIQEERISSMGNGGLRMDLSIRTGFQGNAGNLSQHLLDQMAVADTCSCYKCVQDRTEKRDLLTRFFQYRNTDQPLDQRINLEQLQNILQEELGNSGIDIGYEYGVLSRSSNNFVLVNDHYIIDNSGSNNAEYRHIKESGYAVTLFSKDEIPPGMLMIFFPTKATEVWSEILPNLLGTIFFSAIILLCFAYTIFIILRQKKVSEMKNDFINNMTHEFKTPIATISLAADSITSPMVMSHPDKLQRFANIIKQENKRMNSQVEKVLQMAVIDKREFSLKLTDVNLHDVIYNAVENITLQVEKKEGTVNTDLEATQPIIQGDLTHISNIINNLLDNANKYSPEQPEITVSTRNRANGVEVVVADKGIGMTKEARKHIFDKFYRVHTGNLHDVKGFGLGLSYVKAIMTAHKGQVDVKSELGKGSSFILFFPLQVENKQS
ncbi:sensor histidine kinase [Flavilitoribacter nigricans]|uniref:histidine kinase n=1 Tax=Flavilitoribacter nigricans (strain ATCC 23147 / DSM 23189 / NBRC 102662 / NCIMB 1420 / SS-2) TaxID=1122177 RepID=A0A2D0N6I4_FLAN2|nr:HAMP domain-containing sensor histidine kinase [Flavilitoribacter nigricans]PHN04104.1 histidine kinase [Flavilitoribacter nigricans DSM 23189 = NBRC 102662]